MNKFLWAFARGDMGAGEFETLLYNSPDCESILGRTTYLDLLETDFSSPRSVSEARLRLVENLAVIDPQTCKCLSWRNETRVPLGFETGGGWFSKTFRTLERQTPWLDHVRCNACEADWYVATDTIDDNYYFHRMTPDEVTSVRGGSWPTLFDGLKAVWPSKEWLASHGFASLEEWRLTNGA